MSSLSLGAKYCLILSFCHDTAWWVNFLRVFKGKRFLDDRPTGDAMTDACTLVAEGQFRGDCFYFNFSIDKPKWSALHIDHTETLAIVLAAQHWGHLWANYWVVIYSDDQPAAQIINKGTTGHTTITGMLQALSWLSGVHNFYITAIYLEGNCNTTADAISRLHKRDHLFSFYSFLHENIGCAAAYNMALTDHIFLQSLFCIFDMHATFFGITVATGNL